MAAMPAPYGIEHRDLATANGVLDGLSYPVHTVPFITGDHCSPTGPPGSSSAAGSLCDPKCPCFLGCFHWMPTYPLIVGSSTQHTKLAWANLSVQ